MKTYGIKATSLFAFFRIVTSYILKGVLSSNMKLFRKYQREILQRCDQECVNDLWKDRERWERKRGRRGWEECFARARYNSDVAPFAIMRMSHAFSVQRWWGAQVIWIRFKGKSVDIISEEWFCSEISLYRMPTKQNFHYLIINPRRTSALTRKC